MKVFLDGHSLTLEVVHRIAYDEPIDTKVELSASARTAVEESKKFIDRKIGESEPIYGVNTGFGVLSSVKIDASKLQQLQLNLLRSHAVGVGKPLSIPEVRAAILLRANTLAKGYSGVSTILIDGLLGLLNAGVHPWIPEQGSVGACGDLAPLAHLALVLVGEGRAFFKGQLMDGHEALKQASLSPIELGPKEGLSLINGTQIMTAVASLLLYKAKRLSDLSLVAAAMSIEAFAGSAEPFDELVQRVRPHRGQMAVAQSMRKLLEDSEIMQSHFQCGRVQDPYSFRCIPQVHGVAVETLEEAEQVLSIEINSATDNPLVESVKERLVNAGNFHGEYVAMTMDKLAIAVAELGSISERRIEKLINPAISGLPPFLTKDSGLNSGLMIVQVAAASLVSENKVLCHPATVDSIPTSADKEDHVSMGTIAARKARSVVENVWNVISMEFLAAAQGLEFRKPLRAAKRVNEAYLKIRKKVEPIEQDRAFYLDLEKISHLMSDGELDLSGLNI